MKFLKYIVAAIVVLVMTGAFQSCRKRSPNGELDGQWQILTIEDKASGDISSPYPKHYICLNLHVVNLTVTDMGVLASGNMHYDKNAATISFDFPASQYDHAQESPRNFGFMTPRVTFEVNELNGKKLVMESPETIITCRRF